MFVALFVSLCVLGVLCGEKLFRLVRVRIIHSALGIPHSALI